ncbi:MAG TPA: DNA replication and repair protein RecF [Gemmatimonadaceae bacterium]|nr:DNA replication and repair protein RecF [Gemmatimonadaceae bacterium]
MSDSAARLIRLDVRDFRNLAHVELSPPREGIVVVGENGQGKTNLLEAIHYLQLLRSSRGARDQDLVRFGADAFHIGATVHTDGQHEIGVGFERATKRKRARIDGCVPERLSDALGALPSVMFSPDDVELITGSPNLRRRFLDVMLALTNRGYLVALQHYRAALLRRNAALRDAARTASTGRDASASIAVWEAPLARYGAVLWTERRAWVASIEDRLEALCHEIGETGKIRARYASTLAAVDDPAAAIARALEDKRPSDLRRGLTHAGPHRDDLALTLDGRELRVFGSAGQQRTAAIALRMLEAATLTERAGRAPLLLLDDPFAELDTRRAKRILEWLSRAGRGQTVMAVPRESEIPGELTNLERMRVTAGAVARFSPA